MESSGFEFMSFESGSCGNCYLLRYDGQGLLIDAGVGLKSVLRNLRRLGLDSSGFEAVLVTHDHLDHIRNLGTICRKLQKPVYASEVLHEALARHSFTRGSIASCRKVLEPGWNELAGFRVKYFLVPHDATQTCAFVIQAGDLTYVHMTDLGRFTDEAMEYCKSADIVTIESNYDVQMLERGTYHPLLKQRITNGNGHLSNAQCAAAVRGFWHEGLRAVFLCHLSENNNTPEMAWEETAAVMRSLGALEEGQGAGATGPTPGKTMLKTLPRTRPGSIYRF